jgi:hypothetical protein
VQIVSDSRNVHTGQTLTSGDLAVGTANPGAILDRGEFNVVGLGTGRTLNGSFYVLFTAGGCQFNVSAIASCAAGVPRRRSTSFAAPRR